MGTFADMSMEMNIGDNPFEEDGLFEDTAERTGEGTPDGFLPVTGSVPDNPFEDGAEQSGRLPVVGESTETGELVETEEESACPREDAGEEEEPEEKETDATDSDAEKESEDKKRAEHEAAEARRKAEWEAKRQEKQAVRQAQLDRIRAMNEEELTAESMKRISADTEKLTRRNMKECVSEYIQTACLEDAAFARQVMLPQKNMVRCFQYINRKAYEYVQDEMKAAGIQPGRDTPCYSSDIPDDLCYHWAEEYFRTGDVKEDKEDEEEFVPKPYVGKTSPGSKGKKTSARKSPAKKPAEKKAEKKEPADNGQMSFMEQLSLEGLMTPEKKAG
ncbi:PcfK-like protein [Hungatella effluvii]|uniref:PcfK-like protein n=1 Tax=Hungatella effluvii TaxID=1096246 RepID=A0A2V3Y7U9_9FIRM|nr:Cas9 inhibitor AcrIIA9 family protein [Hungatella effluvii]PXX54243.1 PcfK-like protein [Hungatella effluvii]